MSITAKQKLAEVRKELGYRRWLYPRKVADGKMEGEEARTRIAIMEAIQADYERLELAERPQKELPL